MYGGKLLAKEKTIAEYNLLEKGVVYVIDNRNFKRVTQEEYESRLKSARKIKENNRPLVEKAR
jgi:hypothetical protein